MSDENNDVAIYQADISSDPSSANMQASVALDTFPVTQYGSMQSIPAIHASSKKVLRNFIISLGIIQMLIIAGVVTNLLILSQYGPAAIIGMAVVLTAGLVLLTPVVLCNIILMTVYFFQRKPKGRTRLLSVISLSISVALMLYAIALFF